MRIKTVSCLAAAVCMAACAHVSTTNPGLVGIERSQNLSVPAAEYNQVMAQSYANTVDVAARQHTLNLDSAMLARVRAIGQRVIAQTTIFRADASAWSWEINVVQSPELNAFSLGEGKIVFYSGIIETLRLSDAEIAAILGHEIAHELREHGRERASQRSRSKWVSGMIGAVVGDEHDEVGYLSSLVYLLPNSREQETEADRIGVELAARAGYDPKAAIAVWQKVRWHSGGQPPQFLSTHPSHESRLKDLLIYSEKVSAALKPVKTLSSASSFDALGSSAGR